MFTPNIFSGVSHLPFPVYGYRILIVVKTRGLHIEALNLKTGVFLDRFKSVTSLNYTCTLCYRTIKTQSADYLIGVNLRLVIDSKQLNDETVIISKMLRNLNDAQTQEILNKNFDFILKYYLNIYLNLIP